MPGCRLHFAMPEDDDSLIERLVSHLDGRHVPHSLFITYVSYGEPGVLTLLLPAEHAVEAVYLSFWDAFRSAGERLGDDQNGGAPPAPPSAGSGGA